MGVKIFDSWWKRVVGCERGWGWEVRSYIYELGCERGKLRESLSFVGMASSLKIKQTKKNVSMLPVSPVMLSKGLFYYIYMCGHNIFVRIIFAAIN